MKLSIFFIIFIFAFFIQAFLIKKLLINKLSISKPAKSSLTYILYFIFLLSLTYPLLRYSSATSDWIYFLSSLPIGILFLSFCISIIYYFLAFVVKKTIHNKNRREFLKKSLDTGALALILASSSKAVYNAKHIEVETLDIKIKNLKKSYNIVQISDVHIGNLVQEDFIKIIVNKINELNPDVVVITGDLVDTKIQNAKLALNELKNIKSKFGIFFIAGNHEYFHGLEEIMNYVRSLGIKTLENENVYIGKQNKGFYLAGVYDRFGYKFGNSIPDIKKALQGCKKEPIILLAHQPKYINEIEDTSKISLVLSGHTHGGQIFPFGFLVKLEQPYIKGLHQHNKTTKIYVNKGTGFWGPQMRLGASSEITLLRLS